MPQTQKEVTIRHRKLKGGAQKRLKLEDSGFIFYHFMADSMTSLESSFLLPLPSDHYIIWFKPEFNHKPTLLSYEYSSSISKQIIIYQHDELP